MASSTRRYGRRAVTSAAVVLLLAACGDGRSPGGEPTDPPASHELPTAPASPEPTSPEPPAAEPTAPGDLPAEVEAAVADLAEHLGVETDAVVVVSHEDVTWPDGALGCPRPGMSYTQALVPGARLVLEVDGREYAYHSGRDTPLVRCDQPTLG